MSKSSTFHDFGCGKVPAHRHANGGGWVADADEGVSGHECVTGNPSPAKRAEGCASYLSR